MSRHPAPAAPEPWERQPGEPSAAFEAFTVYRDLGADRSLAKAGQKLGKATHTLERWSVRWQWVARAQAWETAQDRARLQAQLRAAQAAGLRHAALAEQTLTALSQPVQALLARLRDDPDALEDLASRPVEDLLFLIARCAQAMKPVVEVERLARGLATEHVALKVGAAHDPLADAILADPTSAHLAGQLFARLVAGGLGGADAGGPGPTGEGRALDAGTPPAAAE